MAHGFGLLLMMWKSLNSSNLLLVLRAGCRFRIYWTRIWSYLGQQMSLACRKLTAELHVFPRTLRVHDDVIKWKHFPSYWTLMWEIHRSPVNSPHKAQWRGMFSLICAWTHGWVNNWDAGDLRRHHAHHNVIVTYRWFKNLCWPDHSIIKDKRYLGKYRSSKG